jgi:hypothetical protein
MKKLLVGDTGEYLSHTAKRTSTTATLLNDKNYKLIKNTNGTYYTSLGDISDTTNFCDVLMCADEIEFCPPPGEWSDRDIIDKLDDKRFTIESETKEHLYQWMWITQKTIKNLTLPEFNTDTWKITPRISDKPQIWNIGGSITKGVGVMDHERYGNLIAKRTNQDISILAYEGSSVVWGAHEILMADVLPGDTVVWDLPPLNRYSYVLHNDRFYHVNHGFYKNYPLVEKIVPGSWIDSPNNFYHSINATSMIQNFCKKIGMRLISLCFFDFDHYSQHIKALDMPRKQWIDYGTDKIHPGPITHQLFADKTVAYMKLANTLESNKFV